MACKYVRCAYSGEYGDADGRFCPGKLYHDEGSKYHRYIRVTDEQGKTEDIPLVGHYWGFDELHEPSAHF